MDKKTIKTLMKTGDGEQSTPQWLFDFLDNIFHFDIDLCASKSNAKCKKYFSLKKDAFKKKWKGICWMNPPYGKGNKKCEKGCNKKSCIERGYHFDKDIPGIGRWMERAYKQHLKNKSTIVCLIPARTETNWFYTVWEKASYICFIKGRLVFNKKGVEKRSSAPFPSVLAIFGKVDRDKLLKIRSKLGVVINWHVTHII